MSIWMIVVIFILLSYRIIPPPWGRKGSTIGTLAAPIALGGNTLTLAPASTVNLALSGGGAGTGGLTINGSGTVALSGTKHTRNLLLWCFWRLLVNFKFRYLIIKSSISNTLVSFGAFNIVIVLIRQAGAHQKVLCSKGYRDDRSDFYQTLFVTV